MAEQIDAEELLKRGDLDQALDALQSQIRANPADAALRVFLFQLLSVMGSWDRALNQLNVVGELDASALPMVQTYREILRCEVLREAVFAGQRQPLVFGDPERWIALALETLKLVENGSYTEAAELREQAYEGATAVSGKVNGDPFEWIADADSRIGPFLETIVNGGYYWIPFHRIARVELSSPEDLRDLVWVAASFTWANGGEAVGFVPTRYPGNTDTTEPECLLSRRTEWSELDADTYVGRGQRVLTTDAGDYSLLEITTLELDSPADEVEAAEE